MTATQPHAETEVGRSKSALISEMSALVSAMARALVDLPSRVDVIANPDGEGTNLLLRVAPDDLGKVIGKQGRTARSMRTILAAASMKSQHRFGLDIEQITQAGTTASTDPR